MEPVEALKTAAVTGTLLAISRMKFRSTVEMDARKFQISSELMQHQPDDAPVCLIGYWSSTLHKSENATSRRNTSSVVPRVGVYGHSHTNILAPHAPLLTAYSRQWEAFHTTVAR